MACFVGLFARLTARPWLLLAVCLAANAVCQPYAGLYHDAELYAAQVIHAGTGRFANDLFFRYGSQSDYTVVPLVLGLPTQWVGVEPLFLAAYLVANAARLWATQALTFRLLGRTPAAAAGLLLGAVASVPLGCEDVFLTNEPFFTARVPALAACLFALERALAGRVVAATVLFAVGAAMHPLIATPAVAVAASWSVWNWATTRRRQALVGACAGLGLMAGVAYLATTAGTLDEEWRQFVMANSALVDPLAWTWADWFRLATAAGAGLALPWPGVGRRRFVGTVVLVAATGLLLAVAVARGSWALPLQVQPFRAVWPLEVLRLPLCLTCVAWLWTDGPGRRTGATVLLAALLVGPALFTARAVLLLAAGVAVAAILQRVTARGHSAKPTWVPVAAGVAVWGVAWYGAVVVPSFANMMTFDALGWVSWPAPLHVARYYFGPFPRAAVGVLVAGGIVLLAHRRPRTAVIVAATVGIAVPVTLAAMSSGGGFFTAGTYRRADAEFVRGEVARRWAGDRPPTVYWPVASVRTLWVDIGTNAYFHPSQMAANIYSRDLAVEAARRQRQVLPFEIDRALRELGRHAALSGLPVETGVPPSADDFRALVAEPGLDFVVLSRDFGGWVATNREVFLYDCQQLHRPQNASDGEKRSPGGSPPGT